MFDLRRANGSALASNSLAPFDGRFLLGGRVGKLLQLGRKFFGGERNAGVGRKLRDSRGKGIGSYHPGVAGVVLANGQVRFIDDGFDPKLLRALLTINGGEDVSEFSRD